MGVGDGIVEMNESQKLALRRSVPPPDYNPTRTSQRFSKEPFAVVVRVVQIGLSLGGFGVGLLLDNQRGEMEKNAKMRADQLRRKLTTLGPAFVKVGQALSTRPDLLPGQYLNELSSLQDALPTFPDAAAFETVEFELGRPLEARRRKLLSA